MSYVLISKDQLKEKGLFPYAETLPDGRAIIPLRSLKTLSGLTGVDIVDAETVKTLLKEAENTVQPDTEIIPDPESDVNEQEHEQAGEHAEEEKEELSDDER